MRRKTDSTFLFMTALLSLSVYGWIANIVKLIGMDEFSGFMVARVIGAFIPPIGIVLGYF